MSGDGMGRRVRAVLCAWTLRRVSNGMLLLSLAAMGVCAGAQTAVDGAIRGDVKSADGNALARSEVRATARATAIEFKTVTDSRGEFALERVPPGEYDVRVEAKGFQPELVGGVVVEIGGVAGVEVRLSAAGAGVTGALSATAGERMQVENVSSARVDERDECDGDGCGRR